MKQDIIIENQRFRLTIGSDAIVKSLVAKHSGEELLFKNQGISLCSVTQSRPYHNEVKLAHPNKRTTYQANRIRFEKDRLIIGFEVIPYDAVISLEVSDCYICFTLEDFIVPLEKYAGLKVNLPPVEELRILQLPIKDRKNFGEWLNASWDDDCTINLLATSPEASIDSERRMGYRVMYADALREVRLKGTRAALIVSKSNEFFDCMDRFEEAPRMKQDLTRLNFGWWHFWADRTQADMYEYGTSRAAAWDCPATICIDLKELKAHARTDDILEVMRRWEAVRASGWLTDDKKLMLRDLSTEHILLINENREYELVPYYQVKQVCHGDAAIRAFVFSRGGKSFAVYWHTTGSGRLILDCKAESLSVQDELYLAPIEPYEKSGVSSLPLDNRRYICTELGIDELTALLEN